MTSRPVPHYDVDLKLSIEEFHMLRGKNCYVSIKWGKNKHWTKADLIIPEGNNTPLEDQTYNAWIWMNTYRAYPLQTLFKVKIESIYQDMYPLPLCESLYKDILISGMIVKKHDTP
ncbi:hypothetical protein [Ancylomarina sp. 16SWW S1-10-2]|uniref:hypothetical protein n=1 Tax=Ancylomarina sp. 16SWW S1-10-2 TaxID=2499681 RepID=UPI0012ADE38D|nr:hypothetical protein [Ancylomarina sp. 16SWW S1-10-2]MRT92079.1 hypothetical protein [Ancylomarina sp. 16SWW S1-10-2]